jgi:hypothetical protein
MVSAITAVEAVRQHAKRFRVWPVVPWQNFFCNIQEFV